MIKVKNTRIHKYTELEDDVPSFYEVPVAEGKLILIKHNFSILNEDTRVGSLLFNTKTKSYSLGLKASNSGMVALTETTDGTHWNGDLDVYKPIIISELEVIEIGDKFLFQGKHIETAGPDGIKNYCELESDYGKIYKILALPEHFSPKLLQAIVDGKLKDGDGVLVECDTDYLSYKQGKDVCQVKLNPYITLYPTSKTAEDYKEELRKAIEQGQDYDYNYDGEHEYRVDTFNTEWALEAVMEVVNRIVSDLK